MLAFLKIFFSDTKNIIMTLLLFIILGLFIHNKILSHRVESLKLDKEKLELSIKKQNEAIEDLNTEFEKSKKEIEKKYSDLLKKQKPLKEYIQKQESYVSPQDKNELDASRDVLKDFVKNRGAK